MLRERWDNLIILDACRYDTFNRQFQAGGLKGRLESRISRGSETKEFLYENFGQSPRAKDLVYVTASPWVTKNFKDKFHAIVPVWRDGWNDENHTVLPEEMYRQAIQANETYPDKRLIVHFVQPHRPFIGFAKVDWWRGRAPPFRFRMVWGSVAEGGRSLLEVMDNETMMRFYERNLKLVLPFVQRLMDSLKGVTVVSADHGEAFGEWLHPLIPIRVYGHPGHTRIPSLTRVPWLIVESEIPKLLKTQVEEAVSKSLTREEEDLINQRLSALGYT
ncbi:MAG TPA: hypothetical protein VGR53_09695 [Nitrososphaerales archaeon]|nr:hypothetical protein [Nitrososphaerales archaeon]